MALPRPVVRSISVLVCLVGLALALAASVAAAYQAAKATPWIGLLVAVVLVVFFLCSLMVAALASKLWHAYSRRFSLLASALMTALLAAALTFTVLRPMHYPHLVPVPRANTQYWLLPTGSRIAYSVYEPPAGVLIKPDPIVFLHGGPGVRALDDDHRFYSQFAKDGFRVYLYDQAGSGLSDRLPHATDYTVERALADLEAIRKQIGAERMILIGHSMGGTLAAHYAAAYPNRVAKLVFHSPGAIWSGSYVPFEFERTDAEHGNGLTPPPRAFVALALGFYANNVTAAEHLVPQVELGDWEVATADPGELVCKGERNKLPSDFSASMVAGMNMYPLIVMDQELKQKKMDVRLQLAGLHVPAIALEGECDMIPWSEHSQYKRSISGLQEFYFADAGHYINFSQPEKLAAVIRAFLLDQPPPFPAYQGDKDPRPPIPKVTR